MTCILSMMPIFSNPCLGYCEEGSEVLDELDGPWVGARTPGTPETMRCSTPCRIEASTVTGTRYDMASSSKVHITENKRAEESYPKNKPLADSISADVENSLHEVTKCETPTETGETMCNQFGPTRGALESCGDKRAVKRKLDDPFCDIYVPPKRISPFLNTPKEKKEERRKILKMSIKKLKQLEDPETFLRRTVLVNNTRKRIQSELKEEKATGKYEYKSSKSSLAYDVLNNDCLSNSYLLDDPFLSGIHDKITDDMTDTLINNLKDKLCDNVVDSDPKHMDTSDSSFTNSEVCKSSDSNAGSCKQSSQKTIGQFTELKSVSETSCHKSVSSGESRVPGDLYSSYQNISENNNDIKVESNTCSSDCSVPLQNDGHILDQCAHSHSSQTFVAHAPDRLVSMPDFRIQSVTDQDKENTGSSNNSVNYFSSTSDWCVDIDQDMSVCGKPGSDVRDMEPLHSMGNKQVLSHSTYVRTNLDVDQTFQLYSLITGKEL